MARRRSSDQSKQGGGSRRLRLILIAATAALLETFALWVRSGRVGGNVVVRCQRGHLFTTLWIPAASLKSLRFGLWRVQYCPIGRHWTIVTPVKEASLSEDQRRLAREHHDVRIP
jgi:hypothetical protein